MKTMAKQGLDEIFKLLEADGWAPMLCDTRVPFYDACIPCGSPEEVGENYPDMVMLPRDLMSMNSEFTIRVKGDSMEDAGIRQGDVLKVSCDVDPHDGDIVVASIDGSSTVKVYCADEEGGFWLLPQNSKYQPIPLNGKDRVRIIARVTEIIKTAPRIPFRDCLRAIRAAKMTSARKPDVPQQRISQMMREVAPAVGVARQWYAVYRGLQDMSVDDLADYGCFCERVRQEVPAHQHLPSPLEMSRMAVGSFTKRVMLWTDANAPVTGKRFRAYKELGLKVIKLLGGE